MRGNAGSKRSRTSFSLREKVAEGRMRAGGAVVDVAPLFVASLFVAPLSFAQRLFAGHPPSPVRLRRPPSPKGRGVAALLAVVVLLASAVPATAEITIPDTGEYVIDTAHVLSPTQAKQLDGWLQELEQKTTAQVKVLTVKTTAPDEFFSFVQRHAETWKLGQKGKDNGALIVLDVDEHHFRVQVGRGLEGIMPDSWCGSLFRQIAKPAFQQGRTAQGLFEATVAVANRIADDAGVTLTGVPDHRLRHQQQQDPNVALLLVIIFAVIVVITIINARRGQRPGRWNNYGGPFWGGFGGGSFGGGSFSGGSFGGGSFGGSGGGGSFGGGGTFSGGGGGGSW